MWTLTPAPSTSGYCLPHSKMAEWTKLAIVLVLCLCSTSAVLAPFELGNGSITPILLDQQRLSRRAICRQFDAIVVNSRVRTSLHSSWTRESLHSSWTRYYLRDINANEGFTGNVAACQAGDISSNFRDAVVRRTNYIRALCHLPAVDLDCEDSDKCQAAALIMAANNDLSHFPDSSWMVPVLCSMARRESPTWGCCRPAKGLHS